MAATLAALETMYLHCPPCPEEAKIQCRDARRLDIVVLCAGLPLADQDLRGVKGKRVRATGGNADMLKQAGMVPVGATLVEAVGLLQRGGIDCQHGIVDWLRTFGYADVAKYVMDYPLGISGPAIGFLMNRDTWVGFTPDQRKAHLKAGGLAHRQDGDRQLHRVERAVARDDQEGQGRTGRLRSARRFDPIPAQFKAAQRETNIATAKNFGVKDPAAIIDAYEKAVEKWRAPSRRRSAATSTSLPT